MRFVQAKERLYRFNYEVLSQVEPEERKQKLQETYANVEEDYKRLLTTSTGSGVEGSTAGTGRWKWISV
jgi:histone acetyltransferase 1